MREEKSRQVSTYLAKNCLAAVGGEPVDEGGHDGDVVGVAVTENEGLDQDSQHHS